METKQSYTREEAAALLGWSLRTLDRKIPPGTPGRSGQGQGPLYPITISRQLIEKHLPAPGGDDNGE